MNAIYQIQHEMRDCHREIAALHPAIVGGAWPDAMGVSACIKESRKRKHPVLAAARLRDEYPNPDHWAIVFEYPTVMVHGRYGAKGSKAYRADLAVIDRYSRKLAAIVEVGDLSNDNKCQDFEALLPYVRVLWLTKAELEHPLPRYMLR